MRAKAIPAETRQRGYSILRRHSTTSEQTSDQSEQTNQQVKQQTHKKGKTINFSKYKKKIEITKNK